LNDDIEKKIDQKRKEKQNRFWDRDNPTKNISKHNINIVLKDKIKKKLNYKNNHKEKKSKVPEQWIHFFLKKLNWNKLWS